MTFWYVYVLAFSLSLFTSSLAGGAKRPRRSASKSSAADIPPASRTRQQWDTISDEALRLACLEVHLVSTGPRSGLIDSLLSFYDTPGPSTDPVTPPTTISTENILLPQSQPEESPPPPAVAAAVVSVPAAPNISSLVAAEVRRYFQEQTLTSNHGTNNPDWLMPGMDSHPTPQADDIAPFSAPPPVGDLLSFPSGVNMSSMPAVPKAVMEKIRKGDYVNFDDLLPNFTPVTEDEFSFRLVPGSGSSVSLVPRNQAKPKVSNFASWMVAFSNFLRIYTAYFPHRVTELVRYQSYIVDFANQFSFTAWLNYDRNFRYRLAQVPSLSWARIDDDLYNRYLRHASLQSLCFVCRNFGHYASSCYLHSGAMNSNSPFRAPQRSGLGSGQVRPPAPGSSGAPGDRGFPGRRAEPCHYFNAGGCSSRECRYAHVCRSCHGSHPVTQCSKRFPNQ